jgi:hypothetical protein
MIIGPKTPLQDVIDFVDREAKDGVRCPCCQRLVKVYRRKLHREMATFIIHLVRRYQVTGGWTHVRELDAPGTRKSSTDGAYLVHWGLLERDRHRRYRPTADGIEFAMDRLHVSRWVDLRNNEPQDFSEDTVSIVEVLGSPFDYEELMRGAP